jgi:hypothetical protein
LANRVAAAMLAETGAPFDRLSLHGHRAFMTLVGPFEPHSALQVLITDLVFRV